MSYPPVFSSRREAVKRAPQRFSCLPTMFGAEVIDHDGRAVHRCPTDAIARDTAEALNEAAMAGSGTLASMIARLR